MTLPRVFAFVVVVFLLPFARAEIGVGDSRDAVIRQAGNPTSHAQRGDREIFLYPHGARVEFLNGQVIDVKGTLPTVTAEPPATAPEPPAASAAAASAPVVAATPAPKAKPAPAAAKPPPPPHKATPEEDAMNPAVAAEALGKNIEKMDTAWGERPPMPQAETFSWVKFSVLLVLHFGFTLLALRIAFKIEEMDAFWSGTLAIAAIDLVVYGILEALGPVSGGISNANAVQGGIGALVMIGTVQKFCFNKRIQNAVVTAMSVKLFVQLLHIFAFIFVLNLLFG